MPRIVATAQIPSVTTDSPTQRGCQTARVRSRPIAHSNIRVPTPAPKPGRERGHREVVLLRAGDQVGREQAEQQHRDPDPAIPIAVHSIQDRAAVAVPRALGVGRSFGSEVVMVTHC
jgi:hypothetical protein